MTDPFQHHPDLRDKIDDPMQSFMRTLSIDFLAGVAAQHNLPDGWWYSNEEREALRANAMKDRWSQDLWVFGYGSLMWDPAIQFAEVRRARIDGYARKFILLDESGGRGTAEKPGAMAALDKGDQCEGLAFRIEREKLDEETYILWQREQLAPAYLPQFMPAQTNQGDVEALVFIADHDTKDIRPDIPREELIRIMATGEGVLGTAIDYLRNVVEKLEQLDITDPDTSDLLERAEAYLAERA